MPKEVILKNKSGSKDDIYNIQIDKTQLETNNDIDFNELEANERINYADKITSKQQKIEQFKNQYQNVKDLMSDEEFEQFYQQVEDDATIKLDTEIDDTKINDTEVNNTTVNTIKINKSQGIIILNNNYKINDRYYSNLNKENFKDSYTFDL